MSESRFRRPLAIFALALVVRVCFLIDLSDAPTFYTPIVDSAAYVDRALALARDGRWDDGLFWQPFFYPAFLAAVFRLFGGALVAARLVQACVSALNCVLVWAIGRKAVGERAGLVAALMLSFYGPVLFFDTQLIATVWASFWALALVLMSVRLAECPTPGRAALCGLGAGLATITRPTFAPFLLALAVWLVWRWRRSPARPRLAPLCAVGLTTALLAPATVGLPALRTTGRFQPLPWSGAVNLYVGNNPDTGRTIALRPGWPWESLMQAPYRHGARDRAEETAWFREQVLEYVSQQPLQFAAGLGRKALALISSREIPRNVSVYAYREWSLMLRALVWRWGPFGFPFGVLLPLAAVGLWTHRRRLPAPLGFFLLAWSAAVVLVFVSARYRVALVPLLCVPAAAGAESLAGWVRHRDWRSLGLAAAGAGALTALSTLPGPFAAEGHDYKTELHVRVAERATRAGRETLALEQVRRALERSPDDPDALNTFGYLLAVRGKTDQAAALFARALEGSPQHPHAHRNLARTMEWTDPPTAAEHYRHSIEVLPLDLDAHEGRIDALIRAGQSQEALEAVGDAVALFGPRPALMHHEARALNELGRSAQAAEVLAPLSASRAASPEIHYEYGRALEALGRRDDAIRQYREATRKAPGNILFAEALRRLSP